MKNALSFNYQLEALSWLKSLIITACSLKSMLSRITYKKTQLFLYCTLGKLALTCPALTRPVICQIVQVFSRVLEKMLEGSLPLPLFFFKY